MSMHYRTHLFSALTVLASFILTSQPHGCVEPPLGSAVTRFYVSPDGVDASDRGSAAMPFKTIEYGYHHLSGDNDTLIVRAGSYPESITLWKRSTTVIGEGAIITGNPSDGISRILWVRAQDVTLEGVRIIASEAGRFVEKGNIVEVTADHFTMRHCQLIDTRTMEQMRTDECANRFGRHVLITADRFLLEGNFIRGNGLGVFIVVNDSPALGVLVRDTIQAQLNSNIDIGVDNLKEDGVLQGILIRSCILDTSFVEDNIQTEEMYSAPFLHHGGYILDSCVLANAGENAVDLKGARHVLVDNCLIRGSLGDDNGPYGDYDRFCQGMERGATSGKAVTFGNQNKPAVANHHTIVRRTVIADCFGFLDMAQEDQFYNNTMISNRRTWEGSGQPNIAGWFTINKQRQLHRRTFANNIIVDQPREAVVVFNWRESPPMLLDHNLYFNVNGSYLWRQYYAGEFSGLEAWRAELARINADTVSYIGAETHSQTAKPAFLEASHASPGRPWSEYISSAGSPAYQKGGCVAFAVGSGSGTDLTVDNAGAFCDGWGIVEGDVIRIGDAAPVRITEVNYANGRIALSAPRTWTAGAGVHLSYSGPAPNIGAR
jgi:hypothetical protein